MIEKLNENSKELSEEYENFVRSHPNGGFAQSLNWAKVKSNWKHQALILRDDNGKIKGTALILIQPVPYINKTMLYSPHGPVCDYDDTDTLKELIKAVEKIGKVYNACLFRCDPDIEAGNSAYEKIFKQSGFSHKKDPVEFTTIQPRNSYILPIGGKSADEIMAGFHHKWRYNIRLALRTGVQCNVCGTEMLDVFCRLMEETGQRDGFQVRSKEYFEQVLNAYGENARLYICTHDGTPLSGALAIRDGQKVSYVYGASTAKHRNLMPNYLMQWNMINWAIESGCNKYDFMGIPHYDNPEHPNYGVYRFKKGFGGKIYTSIGEFDLFLKPILGRLTAWCIRTRLYLSRLQTEKKAVASKPVSEEAKIESENIIRKMQSEM